MFLVKNLKFIMFTFFLGCLSTLPSIGANENEAKGELNAIEEVTWTPFNYEEDSNGVKGSLPGRLDSIYPASDQFRGISEYKGSAYVVSVDLNHPLDRFPNSAEEFMEQTEVTKTTFARELGSAKALFTLLPNNPPSVVYAGEFTFYDAKGEKVVAVLRMYWSTQGQLYKAMVIGLDFSLADAFFETLQFAPY